MHNSINIKSQISTMLFKNGISRVNEYRDTLTIKRYNILLKSHTNESFSLTRRNFSSQIFFKLYQTTISDDEVQVCR